MFIVIISVIINHPSFRLFSHIISQTFGLTSLCSFLPLISQWCRRQDQTWSILSLSLDAFLRILPDLLDYRGKCNKSTHHDHHDLTYLALCFVSACDPSSYRQRNSHNQCNHAGKSGLHCSEMDGVSCHLQTREVCKSFRIGHELCLRTRFLQICLSQSSLSRL